MTFTIYELILFIDEKIREVDGIWDEDYEKLKQIKEIVQLRKDKTDGQY